MNRTKIEWCKNPDGTPGYTWNPITGCLNHINGMCKGGNFPCYAYRLATTRLRERYLANKYGVAANERSQSEYYKNRSDPFYPRFWPERLQDIHKGKKGKGVFVCDMSDLFGIGVPEEWTLKVLNEIRYEERRYVEQNRYYLLTKQPQNLPPWSPFPDNCYVGVTVTKPEFLLPALDALDSIQCSVRYLSIEPMLAAFDLPDLSLLLGGSVDWLIIGAQTKPTIMPAKIWVDEITEACKKANIPYFLKDNLAPLFAEGEGYKRVAVLTQDMPRGVGIDH